MKKIGLIWLLLVGLVSGLFAGDMSSKMFHLFSSSINKSDHNFVQIYIGQSSKSRFNLRNSCGTMSALAIHNYYSYRYNGYLDYISGSKKYIEKEIVYIFENFYSKTNVGGFQSGENIAKELAKNYWGYNITKIRSNGYNYSNMIEWDLKKSRPVIILLKGNSPLNNHKIQHFIVVLYASDKQVGYYDPWDGNMKITTKQKFLSSWIGSNYGVIIKEN